MDRMDLRSAAFHATTETSSSDDLENKEKNDRSTRDGSSSSSSAAASCRSNDMDDVKKPAQNLQFYNNRSENNPQSDDSDTESGSSVSVSEIFRNDPAMYEPSSSSTENEDAEQDKHFKQSRKRGRKHQLDEELEEEEEEESKSETKAVNTSDESFEEHRYQPPPELVQKYPHLYFPPDSNQVRKYHAQQRRLQKQQEKERRAQEKRLRKEDSPTPRTEPSKFAPLQVGANKQQRQDYDSDTASYGGGLGMEYKRTQLLTWERKETLLPVNSHGEKGRCVQLVDFDELAVLPPSHITSIANTRSWGKRLLFENLKEEEVSDLVGLATTLDSSADKAVTSSLSNRYIQTPQKHNPLLMIPYGTPLPPSYMSYIQSRARMQVNQDNDKIITNVDGKRKGNLKECFDASAAVAIGMALEEGVTASLLPLAGLHVLRCRALENMANVEDSDSLPSPTAGAAATLSSEINCSMNLGYPYCKNPQAIHPVTGEQVQMNVDKLKWKHEMAFDEWTLPPEEAIFKLQEAGMLRKSVCHFLPDPTRVLRRLGESQASLTNREQTETLTWTDSDPINVFCKRYSVSREMIAANPEVFEIFMTPKPSSSQTPQG
jgi:hypothetical protein